MILLFTKLILKVMILLILKIKELTWAHVYHSKFNSSVLYHKYTKINLKKKKVVDYSISEPTS